VAAAGCGSSRSRPSRSSLPRQRPLPAIALGFRYPATWAFVLRAKDTPGVGLLWFLVRREWRSLGIALGVTAALVAVSLVFDLRLWQEWVEKQVVASVGQPPDQPQIDIPLLLRLPAAA
jgi:hypothetical protein